MRKRFTRLFALSLTAAVTLSCTNVMIKSVLSSV